VLEARASTLFKLPAVFFIWMVVASWSNHSINTRQTVWI
jgi:hypothetical protein